MHQYQSFAMFPVDFQENHLGVNRHEIRISNDVIQIDFVFDEIMDGFSACTNVSTSNASKQSLALLTCNLLPVHFLVAFSRSHRLMFS